MKVKFSILSHVFLFYIREILFLKRNLFFWGCFSSIFLLDGFFSFCTHVLYGNTDLSGFFSNMLFVVMVVSSILGGKLISTEKQNGTLLLLLTKPISLSSFVLGKFIFCIFFWAIIFFNSFCWNYFLSFSSGISWKLLMVNYVGFFLLTAYLQSVSFVISSIFDGQISSIMGSIVSFFFLYLLGLLGTENLGFWIGDFFREISFFSHWDNFQKGIFDLGSIFYFIFWICVCIFFSYRILQERC